jgi:hypothetical protein
MSRNSKPESTKPEATGSGLTWRSVAALGLLLSGFWIWLSPDNSFHPTCTYTVNARVSADVEVSGQKLSSEVVYQNSRSRKWIAVMNSAGCSQKYGNALVYRLANDSLLIVSARLCNAATREVARSGHVNVMSACTGRQAKQDAAFIVDSATRPSTWRPAFNGVDFQITRMTAISTWANPSDDIASVAPKLLLSKFEYGQPVSIQWGKSPEVLIDYWRRYDVRKQRPDRSFEFFVRYDGT